jgi:hypothetical protein
MTSTEPINVRVDYGFWNGEKLTAIEIDGAPPPIGFAEEVAKDRVRERRLRMQEVDVLRILNSELWEHKVRALVKLLPRQFFGFDWKYDGYRPEYSDPF